jgi:hypothetical protein
MARAGSVSMHSPIRQGMPCRAVRLPFESHASMQDTHAPGILEQARKLLEQGWHTNLASGSVTRSRDQKSGLVEAAVWEAMNFLQSERGWIRTEPQPITPSGSWSSE